ncbi:MAG: TraB/GumN family protein [Candidatus Micrarchaeota archaeon]
MAVEKLQLGEKTVFLVGTAHISRESVEQVRQIIESEKPDCVGVELDEQRFHQLMNQQKWRETNVSEVISQGKTHLLLLNIFLSNIQRQLGETVQVKPGEEMIEAITAGQKIGANIALLDRNLEVTMKRATGLIGIREKLKLLWYLLSGFFVEHEAITPQKIEELKQSDMVTKLIEELGKKAPTIKKVLVDERDSFIAERIRQTLAKKMVVVIGAGHLNGLKQKLLQNEAVDLTPLMQLPNKKSILGLLKWLIPLLFVALLGWVFFNKGILTSLQFLGYWILITGGLSAVGAALAKSHPVSILVAFISAPLTTLHPLLASGWFAAAVEAKYRNPTVNDFEKLNTLNSYSDFEKNRVTHLLLVAAYTNLGSTVGVIIAFPTLVHLLA